MLLATALLPMAATTAYAADLFFSEYVEGSGYNKALEIYNATGAAVDLTAGGYAVDMYFNGNTAVGRTVTLTGTVAGGDVFVVAGVQPTTDPAILATADQTDITTSWFNGDDAVVLRKGGVVLDVIGQVGLDPGTEWGTGVTSTGDNTLRRNAAVCAGDPDGSDAFDPSLEWSGYAQNTFDGLGAHTSDCLVAPPPLDPVINEFVANITGTDNIEYVEIYGEPSTDYSAYTVLEIEGDDPGSGVVDEVIAVGTTDANGFYLVNLAANALENGTITLLLVEGFTGALTDDLDTDNDGVFDVTPWTSVVDAVAVNDGGASDRTYGVPSLGVAYDGLAFAPGGASRIPDGLDTDTAADWVRNDFDLAGIPGYVGTPVPGEAYNTPGATNQAVVPPPEACGDPYTPIYQVQGSGLASPLAGTEVAVEGVVVGDFQTGGLNGYYLQDPVGDADATTSDGIFIYAPGGTAVNVGDGVRVRGAVSEYYGLTQLTAGQVWICSTANAVAATPLTLPVASLDDFEPYEGMLVTFPQALVISEFFNFDRYGEIVLTTTRQHQPTAVYEPGSSEAANLAAANLLSRITLDDGRTTQNPDPARHPNGATFDLDNRFRGGDTVADVTGVLDYSFGLYRIQPTLGANYTEANPRPAEPDDVGGTLKVAAFNVLNYFTTLGSRGAGDAEEFTRQRTKIIAALVAIDADVVGLTEIENNTAAIQDLVDGLNVAMGAGTYAYIDTGVIGIDEIKVALIYKPATVSPLGDYAVLDSSVDPRFIDTKNRPVLAQAFSDVSGFGIFTVAVNHLKSKGSDCNDVGDPDLGDGAGNCNLTREAAAEALVDWLATDPTGSGDEDFLIIGDLNSYDKEDPIDALRAGGYTDLLDLYLGEFTYAYLFDGQLGYLDHALAGAGVVDEVTGTTVWHINADEPDLLDYDTTFKLPAQDALYEPNAYRSSDHDAIIVGLDLDPDAEPGPFGKVSPADGATDRPLTLTLDWGAAAEATSYEYCFDTTDDDACATWVSTGAATNAVVGGLSYSTTYYWQVRANNDAGTTHAEGAETAYWSFSTPTLVEMSFRSLGGYDGWVLERDEESGRGGTSDAAGTTALVGDDASDRQYRSILDFDTTALPNNAVITGVTLRIRRSGITGTNPFTTHGLLKVDMKAGAYHDNPVLEHFDFHAVGTRGNVGRFIKTPDDRWYRAPLRTTYLVNRIGHTQFRLRFALDDNDDGGADYMEFFTGNAPIVADRPELVITYYLSNRTFQIAVL
ncbi:MAG: ExeM/NucH family extracellular endonuclease [Actinomycetota bacterium]